jgi:hypothetical protein
MPIHHYSNRTKKRTMYSKNVFFLLFTAFLLWISCGVETLSFTEPQPKGEKNLKEIKKEYIGAYISLDGKGKKIFIDANEIRSEEYIDTLRLSKAELDSIGKYEIKNGDLYELGQKLKYPIAWENDTAIIRHSYTEHYFNFSENQVLRHYKGKLFLNYKDKDGLWKVEIISLKDDILTWYIIPVDNENLNSINEVISTIEQVEHHQATDSDGQTVTLSDTTIIAQDVKKRELKKLIENNSMEEIGRYKRIKN